MSTGSQGSGVLTFAGLTAKFYSPDGFAIYSATVGEADATADDASSKEWCPGDKVDWGQLTGTSLVLTTSADDVKNLVDAKTVAILTWTAPLGADTTALIVTGQAFIASATLNAAENGTLLGPMTFRWATAPTVTIAT